MSELIIEAGRTEGQYWRDLWRYRELFYVLAWRDITVRYKQTVIGVAWALLQPLAQTILLTIVFQYVAHLTSVGAAPYPIMVFAGVMPWQFFTTSLTGASQSVIGSAGLISKIYFPRLIVPAGAVVTALADLFCSFILLIGFMAWYRYLPTWNMLALPLLVLLAFAAALGPGLLLTALTVKYRDFRIVTPFIIQIGTLLTPIGYAISKVPEKWRMVYSLNPMVAVVEDFRWAILGGKMQLSTACQATSLFMIFFFLVLGVRFFRRTEKSFADLV